MITLTPAYGRDYKSKAAVLIDWNKGLDFIINDISSPWDGKPCNRQDLKNETVKFRYSRLTKVFVHKV